MTIQELRKQRKAKQKIESQNKRKLAKKASDKKTQNERMNRHINKTIWARKSKPSALELDYIDNGLSVSNREQQGFQKNGELSGVKFIQPKGFEPTLPDKKQLDEWNIILAKEGL